jgi:hypothetical protein
LFLVPKISYGIDPETFATVGTFVENEYDELPGGRIDEENWVYEAQRPIIEVLSRARSFSGEPVITYGPLPVYVTVTVFNPLIKRPGYDTGIRGDLQHPFVSDTGLTFSFINDTINFRQIGTGTEGIPRFGGGFITAGALWKVETGAFTDPVWTSLLFDEEPVIMLNELPLLGPLCERALSERNKRRTEATLVIPRFQASPRVGDHVRVLNREVSSVPFQAIGITRNLRTSDTLIYLSDQVPFLVSTQQQFGGEDRSNSVGSQTNVGQAAVNQINQGAQEAGRLGMTAISNVAERIGAGNLLRSFLGDGSGR